MKKSISILAGCVVLAVAVSARPGNPSGAAAQSPAATEQPSVLFDSLEDEADVVYLIANSSVVFGPDSRGRSEEITFVGPVTVPKWPMKGYGRRVLPDGRQQIDMELTQSELIGESYLLGGPLTLGEHPDLRSLGTITERPSATETAAESNGQQNGGGPAQPSAADTMSLADFARQPQPPQPKTAARTAIVRPTTAQLKVIQSNVDRLKTIFTDLNRSSVADANRGKQFEAARTNVKEHLTQLSRITLVQAEVVPADFTVERKVLLTTAKGILYNETAVPVRGRIDAIPPVKFADTPAGVNVFRGMELPVALLDKDGNVNGWFYSKAHMAYAVLPAALQRAFMKGTVELRVGDRRETVNISGPVEIHYLTEAEAGASEMEVMVMALRGRSELLGGNIMLAETFSDRDNFSRGQLQWNSATAATTTFDLFVDLYAPSAKLAVRQPLSLTGRVSERTVTGQLEKGPLHLPLLTGRGEFSSQTSRTLYDESERPAVEITGLKLSLSGSQ